MLLTDHFIYLELQKTGCTHTRKILSSFHGLHPTNFGEHNTLEGLPKKLRAPQTGKLKVGNIRNPWDWYVSLWAYGCMKKGGLYQNVATRPGIKRALKNPKLFVQKRRDWQEVYADAYRPDLFQKWLRLVLADENTSLGEGYKNSRLSSFAGLLTYRYLLLYTSGFKKALPQIRDFESLQQFDQSSNFMDIVIRNESIESDLRAHAPRLGIGAPELEEVLKAHAPKSNASQRKGYGFYYDEESRELVRSRERLIVERYGYGF